MTPTQAHLVSQTLTFSQLTPRMTLGDILSQMGIGPKHLTERYSHGDYGGGGGGGHDAHVIYAYEPPHASHTHHVATSKHHYGGGGHKSNAAMSALTLLSFLFFLHILQQCLRDHMMAMTTDTPIMVMTAGREGEEPISKTAIKKMDKAGHNEATNADIDIENKNTDQKYKDLMKIHTSEHTPKIGAPRYTKVYKNNGNRSLEYRGFVNAMDSDFD